MAKLFESIRIGGLEIKNRFCALCGVAAGREG